MSKATELTRSEAISQLAAQLDGPVSLDEFTERVLSIWPSQAKKPQAGVRQNIRDNHLGRTLVFLDKKTLLPMQLAMSGISIRVPLSRSEVDKGLLFISPNLQYLIPEKLDIENLQLVDSSEHLIPTEIVRKDVQVKHLLGAYSKEVVALRLDWWYKKHKVRRKDSLLVTILDWSAGKLRLEAEPNRSYRRQAAEIEASNRELADMLFMLLEEGRREAIWGAIAIPTAYARLQDKLTLPADHWLPVIEDDPRMRWNGYEIHYAETLAFMERLVPEMRQKRASSLTVKLSAEQRNQVYCFKAHYKHRKGLWRRIEIQGGQSLADFDDIMRTAFQHDFMDHMSGFWQRIRRGKSRRFREVELATIAPFSGGGEGAEQLLAMLGLKPGDSLKYVYDFGDWIEYRLELEDVVAGEVDINYPRIVAQNRPRYKYCPSCQEKGQKTVATYICIWCSNEAGEEVIMCEDCIYPEHEEHYLDEIVY